MRSIEQMRGSMSQRAVAEPCCARARQLYAGAHPFDHLAVL